MKSFLKTCRPPIPYYLDVYKLKSQSDLSLMTLLTFSATTVSLVQSARYMSLLLFFEPTRQVPYQAHSLCTCFSLCCPQDVCVVLSLTFFGFYQIAAYQETISLATLFPLFFSPLYSSLMCVFYLFTMLIVFLP